VRLLGCQLEHARSPEYSLNRLPRTGVSGNGRQIATGAYEEGDRTVKSGSEVATGRSSRSECDGFAVTTRPQNAAYRAVAFTGSAPESDRERTCSWIAVTADERGKKMSFLWSIHSSPPPKSSSSRPQQVVNSSLGFG
ncbi:hypothetical protein Taro_010845, partial [Colocasia esculenta]|nr:hypothetical protein [Colocasia esculenta]